MPDTQTLIGDWVTRRLPLEAGETIIREGTVTFRQPGFVGWRRGQLGTLTLTNERLVWAPVFFSFPNTPRALRKAEVTAVYDKSEGLGDRLFGTSAIKVVAADKTYTIRCPGLARTPISQQTRWLEALKQWANLSN
jgi:hypothetical protein